MEEITFGHAVNSGDLIASLAGIKQSCEVLDKKAIIYQEIDKPAFYYDNAVHPVMDDKGTQVTMNQRTFDMIRPLILSQPYVEDFRVWKGEKVVVDLDIIRTKCQVNIPYLAIPTWIMFAFPDMATDISVPWLSAGTTSKTKGKILVNMTERYRNVNIKYYFLAPYLDRLLFTGTRKEHRLFCDKWEMEIPYLEIADFKELAECIESASFFLGNQSMCWNIANALGAPRILEICQFAPNCQPFVGKDNYGFYYQEPLEYYFDMLAKKF